jgi:AAA15 family ATPase/GTPase
MENFIKYLNINNFKSIADLKLEDCRRINLFIGYPNVGKSNVLEALGLFSMAYLKHDDSLNKLVRVKNRNELFFDPQNNQCKVETNLINATFIETAHNLVIRFEEKHSNISFYDAIFGEDFRLEQKDIGFWEEFEEKSHSIKRYIFFQDNKWHSSRYRFLLPPYGENIASVLSHWISSDEGTVNEWIENELKKNNLEYVLDLSDNTIKSQKRLGDRRVRTLPYSSFADTLQRVIFYKTAIASNKNSVLLFEEPEAHAFPPYIKNITQDIIEAKTNQFFIATHSPFVINDFLEYEHLRRETSIFLFDFKNDRTTVKRLTDDEMDEVYEYGEDLFFNIESFLE